MRPQTAFFGAVLGSALLAASGPAWAQNEALPRTVTVQLAVDRAITDLIDWRFNAGSFLEGAARTFSAKFGIKLVFGPPVRWQPPSGRQTIEEHLKQMTAKVPKGGRDILIGIIDLDRITSPSPGIASYVNASILVGNSPDAGAMRYAILHELCHVFGAVDLRQRGSVMSVREPRLEFDPFTAEAVLLHKGRSFEKGSFPLPPEALDPAIALYRGRADLALGEPEVDIFLTLFYMEKEDLEAAAQFCLAAAEKDPDLDGVQSLLGNVCLGRGEPQKAVEHYARALERQPADPALHFNLALACTELRRYGEAADHFRQALKSDAGLVPARLALARLLLAAGSAEAAAEECRRALKSDPRSAEALGLLGTAMVALARPFTPDAVASQSPALVVRAPSRPAPGRRTWPRSTPCVTCRWPSPSTRPTSRPTTVWAPPMPRSAGSPRPRRPISKP
jgi:tetratricopeptide (TPR) repeat protein